MSIKLHNHVQTHLDDYSGEIITTAGKPSVRDRLYGLKMYGKSVQNGTPTPESPIAVKNVPSNFNIISCGKNLFDGKMEAGKYWDFASGSKRNLPTISSTINKLLIKSSTTYTLWRSKMAEYGGKWLEVGFFDSLGVYIVGQQKNSGGANIVVFTSPSNARYLTFNNDTPDLTVGYMLLEGSYTLETIPSYIPPQSHQIQINIKDTDNNTYELCSLPDGTRDEVDVDSSKIIKRLFRKTLDGNSSESYQRLSYAAWDRGYFKSFMYRGFTPMIAYNNLSQLVLSTHFQSKSYATGAGLEDNCTFGYGETTPFGFDIKIDSRLLSIDWDNSTDTQRIDAFRTWLSINKPAFLYKLQTPQDFDLHPDELEKLKQIKSVYPSTNIFTSANIQPNLSCNIRKLGNRPFVEQTLTDEGGNFLVDENGNNIIGVT